MLVLPPACGAKIAAPLPSSGPPPQPVGAQPGVPCSRGCKSDPGLARLPGPWAHPALILHFPTFPGLCSVGPPVPVGSVSAGRHLGCPVRGGLMRTQSPGAHGPGESLCQMRDAAGSGPASPPQVLSSGIPAEASEHRAAGLGCVEESALDGGPGGRWVVGSGTRWEACPRPGVGVGSTEGEAGLCWGRGSSRSIGIWGGHSADRGGGGAPQGREPAPWPEVCSGPGVGLQALLPSSASIQHVVLAPTVCTRRVMPALWLCG